MDFKIDTLGNSENEETEGINCLRRAVGASLFHAAREARLLFQKPLINGSERTSCINTGRYRHIINEEFQPRTRFSHSGGNTGETFAV